jgi:hypothetical protein
MLTQMLTHVDSFLKFSEFSEFFMRLRKNNFFFFKFLENFRKNSENSEKNSENFRH